MVQKWFCNNPNIPDNWASIIQLVHNEALNGTKSGMPDFSGHSLTEKNAK
jgi:hypothetical protein